MATAHGGGSTTIRASWQGYVWTHNIEFGQCTSEEFSFGAIATFNVVAPPPQITSIDPPRGVVGLEYGITLTGSGFTGGSVVVSGAPNEIMLDNAQVSPSTILVDFIISPTAAGGVRKVKVQVGSQSSNEVDFFVRIPTRLRRDNISPLMDQPGGCGASRILSYTLLDQAGEPILSDDTIEETISSYSGPAGLRPPAQATEQLSSGVVNDRIAYDTETTDCPPTFTATWTQAFRVRINTTLYQLSTTNSISVGRTESGTKFVDVTVTAP
jgi:hypothetical protein